MRFDGSSTVDTESTESLATVHQLYPEAMPSDDLRELIVDRFLREVRSFAGEIIEGTNRYRQLQSLVEHLPHDYHDRFLIELIQNAHDASDGGEVRVIFQEPDQNCPGVLYVANRGRPFNKSNFERICSIGWSDKDPSRNIGNKGIGFRSVLQICRTPEIFSIHPESTRQDGITARFDGFSFHFLPEAREWAAKALDEVGYKAIEARQCSVVLSDYLVVTNFLKP